MTDTHTRTQHTPGPWHVATIENEQVRDYRIRGPRQFPDAAFGHDGKEIASLNGYLSDELDANARLIAAAPDLLAALEAIYECQVAHTSGGICHEDHDELNQIARATIRKARGEE